MEASLSQDCCRLSTLFVYFIIVISNPSGVVTATTITKNHRLKLIHRNSLLYPRLKPDDIRGEIFPAEGGPCFFVNISIGEPPVPQLVAMDTGSNLLWLQCRPCRSCIHQPFSPIFDPSVSSTFSNIQCNSPTCLALGPSPCNSEHECVYYEHYVDGTRSTGSLATEKLTLLTSDGGITSIPDVMFGCGHNNSGISSISGILGLGPASMSLVRQLGSTFSYCVGSLYDPLYAYNQLILGSGARIEGYSTPMHVTNGLYYLFLEGISLGENRLDIAIDTFHWKPPSKGGVVIDTGSTYTYLTRRGFQPLHSEVQKLMNGMLKQVEDDKNPDYLCYEGIISRDLKGFPVTTFHFAAGADLVLDIESMFRQEGKDIFCMTIRQSEVSELQDTGMKDLSVIGMTAQQNYNIAYDLNTMQLYFERIDCDLLED